MNPAVTSVAINEAENVKIYEAFGVSAAYLTTAIFKNSLC
jgi:hypothetical protein